MNTALALVEAPSTDMAALIQTATTDELATLNSGVEAIRAAAKKMRDRDAERKALEARMHIERRFGVLLRDGKASGLITEGKGPHSNDRIKLEQLGISRNQSSAYQRIAAVSETDLMTFMNEWRTAFKRGAHVFPATFIIESLNKDEIRHAVLNARALTNPNLPPIEAAFVPPPIPEGLEPVEDVSYTVVEPDEDYFTKVRTCTVRLRGTEEAINYFIHRGTVAGSTIESLGIIFDEDLSDI